MIATDGWADLPPGLAGAAVALGAFDGLHRGHAAVLAAARTGAGGAEAGTAQAGRALRPLVVVAFEPPPKVFFAPPGTPARRLTTPALRAEAAAALGADALVALRFDAARASQSPQDFAGELLAALAPAHLAVGHDFRFGAGRAGDGALLAAACAARGTGFSQLEPVGDASGERISSTRIRMALEAGDIATATNLLGRPWQVEGVVEHGEKRGRSIGWPTANFRLGMLVEPLHGIYTIRVRLPDGTVHGGVANFGRTPTTGLRDPLFEAHLFDFAGDLYGQRLVVELIAFQRPEARFNGLDELVAQIARDGEEARARLALLAP